MQSQSATTALYALAVAVPALLDLASALLVRGHRLDKAGLANIQTALAARRALA